ncbi:MAG: cysteine desulfurase [Candidatus Sungbacteria bacterium]|uniref:Cysteine desulfurase n=1 Tax=Candidatus Sungiibacteriota bacterium TaxID=2750080 RepID=A0A932YVT8_9BACT|nr:cysteine desulfurase [Candidatus Sungbacteria bacterium]
MREIYLDHAAATPLDPRVKAAMAPYWDDAYGNPSALYRQGRLAKDAVDASRETVAWILGAKPDEIIFTAGSTEADNIAIFGAAGAAAKTGHLITTAFEHHAGLRTFERLERDGWAVTYLPVSVEGIVEPETLRAAIRPDTLLVSVMYANNEIGTIQPTAEIGRMLKVERRKRIADSNQSPIYFHCDASQAAGFLDLNVERLGADLLSLNGGKIYGPKGSGCLYIRSGVRLKPMFQGGGQEKNLRSGTENVPLIVGFAKALEIANAERDRESRRLCELRDYFIRRLTAEIPKTDLNGDPVKRLPNNVNVSILDVEGEAVVLYLDHKGVAISTGSACTSMTLDPSHVILALGKPYEYAHSSLRFTLGRSTAKEDLNRVMEVLPGIIAKLRQISPVKMEIGQRAISHPEAFAGQGARVKIGGRTYK